MSNIYSTPFLSWTTSGGVQSYTVPDGKVAVVIEADAVNFSGSGFVLLEAEPILDVGLIAIAVLELPAAYSSAQWRGRVVVPAGGSIEVGLADAPAPAGGYVGGYLFDA